MMSRAYRLGLDVGTNSIGWFMIWLNADGEPCELGPGGVRIFPDGRDPQSKESNAASRRVARGQRRRRDRYLARRRQLIDLLVKGGLLPSVAPDQKALECLEPYALRAKAVSQKVELHQLGRVLFHLNQRRGFKSNRKSDSKNSEKGAIRDGSLRLREAMKDAGAATLGVFLDGLNDGERGVRARSTVTGGKATYDFYPTRDMLEDEFHVIWAEQKKHHVSLSDELKDKIFTAIFYQRPLKSQVVGKCSLSPAKDASDLDGFRLPLAHPLSQRFRIWQEVRNLAVGETGQTTRPLSKEEGDIVALALLQNGKVSFDKMRKLLKLPDTMRFNLESDKRSELLGDDTARVLSAKGVFGKLWRSFELDRQIEIVERLLTEENESELVDWIMFETGVDEDVALAAADAPLKDGHGRLGKRAIAAMMPHFEQGLGYAAAAAAAGLDHSKQPTGEVFDRLPYYGEWLQDQFVGTGDPHDRSEVRWGRYPNPTVHIGLGQVRRLVNLLIKRFGAPTQIVVELARDLKIGPEQKKAIDKTQSANQKKNEERAVKLGEQGLSENGENRMRMRLWEELNPKNPLDRRCPYSGEIISLERLFSPDVEIDHIIPFQDCWDDSAANKTVCMRFANRVKRKKTPFEAFATGQSSDGRTFDWDDISLRAANLPENKRWRFAPDARTRFDAQGGFQARQLNETSWLSRVTKAYLTCITDPHQVWVTPGRLTAMIRAKWGLNNLLPDHNFTSAKNRADHRHHAIDAAVIALTDRSLLQRISRAFDDERSKIIVPEPWEGFRDQLRKRLEAIHVSHRVDHGTGGQLHEASAYGLVANQKEGEGNLVYRKTLIDLKETEVARIRDPLIRDALQAYIAENMKEGAKLPDVLAAFGARRDLPFLKHGLRHVRLTKVENADYLVTIRDENGRPYKAYSAGENLYVEIFETSNGKWQGEAVSVFNANQKGYVPCWRTANPDARLVMRVYKGDSLMFEDNGAEKLFKVYRLDARANRFKLAPDCEGGNLDVRHNADEDPFRWYMKGYEPLRKLGARKVRVDEAGTLWRMTDR